MVIGALKVPHHSTLNFQLTSKNLHPEWKDKNISYYNNETGELHFHCVFIENKNYDEIVVKWLHYLLINHSIVAKIHYANKKVL